MAMASLLRRATTPTGGTRSSRSRGFLSAHQEIERGGRLVADFQSVRHDARKRRIGHFACHLFVIDADHRRFFGHRHSGA
jgi:hypothetical protein